MIRRNCIRTSFDSFGRLLSSKRVSKLTPVQQTSLLVAYWRNLELQKSQPLCRDEYASVLLNRLLEKEVLQGFEKSNFQIGLDCLAVRTRIIDDWLVASTKGNPGQVVLLGSGMDTRACRLPWGRDVTVFEVDMDAKVMAAKYEVLSGAGIQPVSKVVMVEADVTNTSALAEKLQRAGLSSDERTQWVAEGLLEYLPLTAHPNIFRLAKNLASAPGSGFAMQVLEPSFGQSVRETFGELPYAQLASVEHTVEQVQNCGWSQVKDFDNQMFIELYDRNVHPGFHLLFAATGDN